MLKIKEHFDLRHYNTFGVQASARYFFPVRDEGGLAHLPELLAGRDYMILGGGSNVLFCRDFPGLVVHPEMKGIFLQKQDKNHVWLKVMAGENWDGLVEHTVKQGWGGLENLSLIPGNVGASPIQNIGAYGVEVQDTIESVQGLVLSEGDFMNFDKDSCRFGYRDSIFKREWENRVLIVSVTFRLLKNPACNTGYAQVEEELRQIGPANPVNMRKAIVRIRERKLPDPTVLGNAGSFFKNPVIPSSVSHELKKEFPELPSYPIEGDTVKVTAAWLIEQCGWKGYRREDTGVHQNQPLVLVNYGNATGKDIFELSEEIIESVKRKFGISLEREVRII